MPGQTGRSKRIVEEHYEREAMRVTLALLGRMVETGADAAEITIVRERLGALVEAIASRPTRH